jgi:Domain of unknown function (DUF4166)
MTSIPQSKDLPLYQGLLGAAWWQLAPVVQCAHRAADQIDSAGRFDITHGSGVLARLLVHWMGMPPAGHGVPTRLRRLRVQDGEQWNRTFGKFRLQSTQYARDTRLLAECFGRLEIRFRLEVRSGGICYCQCGAAVRVGSLWLPLPLWLSPRVAGEEMPGQTSNQTRVRVTVQLPLVGRALEYEGQMQTQEIPT